MKQLIVVAPRPAVPPVTRPTYYVSTDPGASDSNSGSISQPWRTIAASLPKLSPNDKLLVRSGTYGELVNVTVTPGTSSLSVLVQAYPGENPLVQGRMWVQNAHYWTFDGIDVTWPTSGLTSSDQMVRMRNSHDWRWTNSELYGAQSTAAFGVNVGQYNYTIDNNIIRDTGSVNGPNQDHLIYVDNDDETNPAGLIERNLLLRSPNGRAIKVGKGTQALTPTGLVVIRYNTMVDNVGPSNVQLSYGASDTEIYRNIMDGADPSYDNITRFTGIGSGNTAHDNVGWGSTGVVDAGTGLADTGGNLHIDPQLNGSYVPQNSAALAYGRWA